MAIFLNARLYKCKYMLSYKLPDSHQNKQEQIFSRLQLVWEYFAFWTAGKKKKKYDL